MTPFGLKTTIYNRPGFSIAAKLHTRPSEFKLVTTSKPHSLAF